MSAIFKDELHEQLGTWPLAYIPYGGADYGEVEAIARTIGDGDDALFYDAWSAAADRMMVDGRQAETQGHRASARECFLRAACFYGKSFHPLFGQPVDPRVRLGSQKQIAAFERALALSEPAIVRQHIPFEGTSLLAYVIPAQGCANEVRPLLIFNNGYDGTITDLFFASAVAASRRGYHSLIFDGPGQGTTLIDHGITLRPDWENVISSVMDFALTLSNVDPLKIVLCGWSLGGYLAPRAASGERRLAACVADPALASVADGFRTYVMKLGATPDEAASLGDLPEALMERLTHIVANDRKLTWSIAKRGYWVNGAGALRDYLASVEHYTMDGRIGDIHCPTLFTMAEHDTLAAGTQNFFDALRCPKTLIRFSSNQGAGEHCEMRNRSLVNRRVLDWIDEVLA
ncbi:alpha/beta hydrolase family protein [Paraburkholderia tropica]|uniref:Alpha-beta hydrolase superfamily lysophospholipase n=1 Tax=Paraburkholderia tropica TaxID=92647 RepID=A0ABX5MQH2_9BURK|nr:alpha/beta fold hydrolase [Paraburkholderia tropica]MBB3001817.1 alpha-beta hydrolase superfamily lysophospholipase [Paraburkholderia tropica]MBB6320987.1 alpha-beta hydrolase superfamily lysophospholipase [Paraburkholderia tropica]MDE1144716.1 alpha/beta fold hydrolase [Paraburkholderia tropica]PXX15933.1 alpha-beta hydrolase superfamily lysophospholipase [Paraburkholderia tropica]PZW82192.1 alpha-beta hydrolase superfamily lysophospholipase [Paraburkholderia tropica]